MMLAANERSKCVREVQTAVHSRKREGKDTPLVNEDDEFSFTGSDKP